MALIKRPEQKGHGAKIPGSEMARERKGQGASWPGSESARVLLADSLRGANWPGSEKARYRLYYGPVNRTVSNDIVLTANLQTSNALCTNLHLLKTVKLLGFSRKFAMHKRKHFITSTCNKYSTNI